MKISRYKLPKFKEIMMLIIALFFISPLYVALVNAFKRYEDIVLRPLALPFNFTFDNMINAYKSANIGSLYLNSALITTVSLALIIVTASMASHIFAKRKSKIYRYLYIFVLTGIMIPQQMLIIPSIQTLQFFNLLHSFPGLYLFYVGTYMSIAIFFYVEFIKSIPDSIEESGIIDGANNLTIFFKLIFPLLKPCTATSIIYFGLWIWNDFLPPMYILGSRRGRTITTGIYNAIGSRTTQWDIVFACVIFSSVPIIVIYLLMQKQFRKGLTAGAVKG